MAAETQDSAAPPSTRERLAEKKKQAAPAEPELSFMQKVRGSLDALVFAYVLAMFIRSYVFELFMIPTGSMTPTLIGDNAGEVAFEDYDGDGTKDVVYTRRYGNRIVPRLHIYLMNPDGTYKDQVFIDNAEPAETMRLTQASPARKDMIIVNKFAYWFSKPDRGDIAVFKVPDRPPQSPFMVDKPVYIKRVLGMPGETATFVPAEVSEYKTTNPNRFGEAYGGVEYHLKAQKVLIDGKPLEAPPFDRLMHYPPPQSGIPLKRDSETIVRVPDDSVLMVGDNSASSSDGRIWGGVPLNHLRGKALFRYWPLKAMSFLE
jgi:signal peptidase I